MFYFIMDRIKTGKPDDIFSYNQDTSFRLTKWNEEEMRSKIFTI